MILYNFTGVCERTICYSCMIYTIQLYEDNDCFEILVFKLLPFLLSLPIIVLGYYSSIYFFYVFSSLIIVLICPLFLYRLFLGLLSNMYYYSSFSSIHDYLSDIHHLTLGKPPNIVFFAEYFILKFFCFNS